MKVLSIIFPIILFVYSNVTFSSNAIRVVTEEFPPYQVLDNDKLVSGTAFFLVEEMLKRANIKTQVEVLPWARAYAIASTEPNVVIFSLARNETRENKFKWLYQIDSLNYHFYTLSSRPDLQQVNLADALGYVAVTVRNSYEAQALTSMGYVEGENLILTCDYQDAWQMLALGRADFTYATQLFQDAFVELPSNNPPLFVKAFHRNESSALYIAASVNTDVSTLLKLRLSLKSMHEDGTAEKLLLKPPMNSNVLSPVIN
jgi:polar amino acid transport system substrate-binding protein